MRLFVRVCILLSALIAAVLMAYSAAGFAQPTTAPEQPKVTVDADGTVHVPPFSVPVSSYLSSEAKADMTKHITEHGWPQPAGPITGPGPIIDQWRREMDEKIFIPAMERQKAVYPVTIEAKTIAGVRTDVVTPKDGLAPKNKDRVLINLHSGGFQMGAGAAGVAESVPIAAVGKIKVITVDYRQGPEHKFPAASEDVAAVYRDLLKQYKAERIGIYGCSAGGRLAAQAVAWFQKEKLPRPGAIGIFCSSAGGVGGGDSTYVAPPLNGQSSPPLPAPGQPPRTSAYFAGTDPKDPLIAPVYSPDVLAKFPPTLVVTATRDMALSSAVYTHTQLVKAGVDAELHVWEGLGHGFFYSPDMPESKEAYDVIVHFFDQHLGAH